MMKISVLTLSLVVASLLASCNTIAGLGTDISDRGEFIEKSAVNTQQAIEKQEDKLKDNQ